LLRYDVATQHQQSPHRLTNERHLMTNHARAKKTHYVRTGLIAAIVAIAAVAAVALTACQSSDSSPNPTSTRAASTPSVISLTPTSNPLAEKKAALIQTANDYSHAAFAGDTDKAWTYLSNTCQEQWGKSLFTLGAAKYASYPDDLMPLTSRVTIQGTLGIVTRTWTDPELSSGGTIWIYNGSDWKMNDCH
jgi:hypothetical protein